MVSRAIHEIQSDGQKLVFRMQSAIDTGEWGSLARLTEQMTEIVQRGLYHASREKLAETNRFAMGNHQEREAR